jgi:hypothetical protein
MRSAPCRALFHEGTTEPSCGLKTFRHRCPIPKFPTSPASLSRVPVPDHGVGPHIRRAGSGARRQWGIRACLDTSGSPAGFRKLFM